MATAQTLLNEAQQRLRDTNARIWTRAELLDYLNEGYRRLCLEASLPGFLAYDFPPRWISRSDISILGWATVARTVMMKR